MRTIETTAVIEPNGKLSLQLPPDEAWVQDWTAWASAYKVWLRRRKQYMVQIRLTLSNQRHVILRRSRRIPLNFNYL